MVKCMLFLLIVIVCYGCAVIPSPALLAREDLSDEGANVKIMERESSNKCSFIKQIETKLFISPPMPLGKADKERLERKNYNEMIVRLKNRAAKLGGNALAGIQIIEEFSNWDRSKPVNAQVYKCPERA